MSAQTMTDEWVATAKLETETEAFELNYYLQKFSTELGGTCYGLRIDKSTPDGVLFEREETLAITDSYEDALIMVKAFAKGSVPPMVLVEVADDWLSA